VLLPSWALSLPAPLASLLRRGDPAVVGRVERDRCLLDLRTVPDPDDDILRLAVIAAAGMSPAAVREAPAAARRTSGGAP